MIAFPAYRWGVWGSESEGACSETQDLDWGDQEPWSKTELVLNSSSVTYYLYNLGKLLHLSVPSILSLNGDDIITPSQHKFKEYVR